MGILTKEAGENEVIFNNFRSFAIVKLIVDGYPRSTAIEYLSMLRKELDAIFFINVWKSNDKFMSPDIFIQHNGQKITPATERNVVNVNNYVNFFHIEDRTV